MIAALALPISLNAGAQETGGAARKGKPQAEAPKARPKKKVIPAFEPFQGKPGLPNVLLIGDSISMGYTLPVRKLLSGEANVHRPLTNCGPTTTANTGSAVLLLPEPIDSNHSQAELRLNYAGERLRLSGGYYGSFYSNSNGTLTPAPVEITARGRSLRSTENASRRLRNKFGTFRLVGPDAQ